MEDAPRTQVLKQIRVGPVRYVLADEYEPMQWHGWSFWLWIGRRRTLHIGGHTVLTLFSRRLA